MFEEKKKTETRGQKPEDLKPAPAAAAHQGPVKAARELTDEERFLASGAKILKVHKRDWENVYKTKDGRKVRFDPRAGARL